jgi:hypothetical protein
MQLTREYLADLLRRTGLPDTAEEALRTLPEVVDLDEAAQWCSGRGITKDELISMMGGSP